MLPFETLLLFAAASVALILTPGPDMLYTMTRSMTQGRRAGVLSAGGIALPPEAVVYVRLLQQGTADDPALTLAKERVATEGRQVPIPFSLSYDPAQVEPGRRYAIEAEIHSPGGDVQWTTHTPRRVLTQGAPSDSVEVVVVQTGEAEAGGGAKYEGDGVMVWNKGDEALLEVGGRAFTGCTLNRRASVWEDAKLSGWDFRAVGQEPGWELLIRRGDRIRFVYEYGEREVVVSAPEPTTDEAGRRTTYRAETEAHTLVVTFTGAPCADAMSGERFPLAVTVTLSGGKTYRGCGRALH